MCYFLCLVSILISLSYPVSLSQGHLVHQRNAELICENRKVKAITELKSASSLLHCTQFCARNENCMGINFNQDSNECELFSKGTVVENNLLAANQWSVYLLKQVMKTLCDFFFPIMFTGNIIIENQKFFHLRYIKTEVYAK